MYINLFENYIHFHLVSWNDMSWKVLATMPAAQKSYQVNHFKCFRMFIIIFSFVWKQFSQLQSLLNAYSCCVYKRSNTKYKKPYANINWIEGVWARVCVCVSIERHYYLLCFWNLSSSRDDWRSFQFSWSYFNYFIASELM